MAPFIIVVPCGHPGNWLFYPLRSGRSSRFIERCCRSGRFTPTGILSRSMPRWQSIFRAGSSSRGGRSGRIGCGCAISRMTLIALIAEDRHVDDRDAVGIAQGCRVIGQLRSRRADHSKASSAWFGARRSNYSIRTPIIRNIVYLA